MGDLRKGAMFDLALSHARIIPTPLASVHCNLGGNSPLVLQRYEVRQAIKAKQQAAVTPRGKGDGE